MGDDVGNSGADLVVGSAISNAAYRGCSNVNPPPLYSLTGLWSLCQSDSRPSDIP
jgi:hypothetical protein